MMPADDAALLRRYVANGAEEAFAELVQRHLTLVYAAALRRVGGDAHLAQDVTQQVFTALARSASSLSQRPALAGWLYTTTRFVAARTVRGERRRHAREKEAHTMHDLSSDPAANADWEKLRPLLDGAMDGLNERDREAVLLRFFEGRSFANIGVVLRVTDDAARMRVERALDKLHTALTRRGVKSTAVALGMALTNHGGVAAPATLASSVTSAALAGAAAGAAGGTAAGFFALIGGSKTLAGIGGVAAVVAGGVAVVEQRRAREAEIALVSAGQQQHALRAENAAMAAQVKQAEQRATEAEKDSGELLKAVEALRVQQAAQAARIANVAATGRSAEEQERLAQERAYQQQLAKRRAEEAKARAKIDSEAAAEKDAATRYHKLIEAAERYAANADFQAGIRTYNLAMEMKPPDLVVTARIRELQAKLQAQNKPVEISLISDGVTTVSVSGPYGMRAPSPLQTAQVRVLPGNYEVIGRRKGYQDVVIPVPVRNGVPAPVISVVCTTPEP